MGEKVIRLTTMAMDTVKTRRHSTQLITIQFGGVTTICGFS